MEKIFYKIFPYLCLGTFLLYWITLFILAMPPNYAKGVIANRAPLFKKMFGTSWKLFSPPNTYNDRLYFIVRNIARPDQADTIEVLENILLQKHLHAPFNQKESLIDVLVSKNLIYLKLSVWNNKKMAETTVTSGNADSLNIANEKAQLAYQKQYNPYLATLKNYASLVLKQKKIDTTGKELKIVIKEKSMLPFNQIGTVNFIQKETLFFETSYKPFN